MKKLSIMHKVLKFLFKNNYWAFFNFKTKTVLYIMQNDGLNNTKQKTKYSLINRH